MTATVGPRTFGDGPLSRLSAFVYTLLAIQLMLLAASLPGLIGLAFVSPDSRNLPLAALCAVPLGPALAAAIYATRHRRHDLAELAPVAQFWRGYRLNWRAVTPAWLIGLGWLTIVAVTLVNLRAVGFSSWWAAALGVVGVLAAVWTTNAVIVSSLFTFRTVDVARLSWYLIGRAPLAALGTAGVLLGAGALAVVTSALVVLAFGALLVAVLVRTNAPLIALVTAEFTGAGTGGAAAPSRRQ